MNPNPDPAAVATLARDIRDYFMGRKPEEGKVVIDAALFVGDKSMKTVAAFILTYYVEKSAVEKLVEALKDILEEAKAVRYGQDWDQWVEIRNREVWEKAEEALATYRKATGCDAPTAGGRTVNPLTHQEGSTPSAPTAPPHAQ